MDFDRLDSILKERKVSRRKLALSTGINEHTMSTAFRRKSGLSVDEVIRIANFLGVDYYYLEGWDKGYDENHVAYYYKDGSAATFTVPFELYENNDPLTIQSLNKRMQEAASDLDGYILKQEVDRLDAIARAFELLNEFGQIEAVKRVQELTEILKYTQKEDAGNNDSKGGNT